MQLSFRLYAPHDYDLIALHLAYGLDRFIKPCIRAYLNGTHAYLPPMKLPDMEQKFKRTYYIKVPIGKGDGDIVEFCKRFRSGYRNAFVKNLVRLYLPLLPSEHILAAEEAENMAYFQELSDQYTGKDYPTLDVALYVKRQPTGAAAKKQEETPDTPKSAFAEPEQWLKADAAKQTPEPEISGSSLAAEEKSAPPVRERENLNDFPVQTAVPETTTSVPAAHTPSQETPITSEEPSFSDFGKSNRTENALNEEDLLNAFNNL